ncbi:alpha/beta hydrolase [Uliginosibacterium gangwonense]|uniref:alpha/beta hydrolase n=1 Tax=Uliginosibacterium gangwonense TaxID=392736 RepID=UPI00036F306F|nr:alpha/beta hydrolase [Uliginosibacterium gangwonense]
MPYSTPLFTLRIACALCLGILVACSSAPDKRQKPEDPALRSLTEHAYSPGPSVGTQQHTETLDGPDGGLQISLIAPNLAGSYPLVIYLPGLGDQVTGGEPWRKAWAGAGYAVLSVQDRQDGMPLLASEKARKGDIGGMARDASSSERRTTRIKNTLFALKTAQQRARQNQPLFASIDFSRVVVAGFDTGAFAALAFSAEAGSPAPADAIPGLKGIIAISPAPPENFSAHGRYGATHLPVLLVSSDADFDEYGIINDIGIRIAPFQAMPKEDKYLLSFKQISHRALSGDTSSRMPDEMQGSRQRGGDKGGPPGGGGRGREGGPNGGGGNRPGMEGGGPGMGKGPDGGPDQRGGPGQGGEALQTVMNSVSLAFLQAYVHQNEQALDWLSLDASRWLRPYGSLSIK